MPNLQNILTVEVVQDVLQFLPNNPDYPIINFPTKMEGVPYNPFYIYGPALRGESVADIGRYSSKSNPVFLPTPNSTRKLELKSIFDQVYQAAKWNGVKLTNMKELYLHIDKVYADDGHNGKLVSYGLSTETKKVILGDSGLREKFVRTKENTGVSWYVMRVHNQELIRAFIRR